MTSPKSVRAVAFLDEQRLDPGREQQRSLLPSFDPHGAERQGGTRRISTVYKGVPDHPAAEQDSCKKTHKTQKK
jgi:hypothetical protein